MKQITIHQFLTAEEIERACYLFEQLRNTGMFAAQMEEQIIRPNIERINRSLGQKNDPRYLAYAVEFVMNEASRCPPGPIQ